MTIAPEKFLEVFLKLGRERRRFQKDLQFWYQVGHKKYHRIFMEVAPHNEKFIEFVNQLKEQNCL